MAVTYISIKIDRSRLRRNVMSVLDGVMREEHDRLGRIIAKVEQEINELPKGYISEKKINGKNYCYLQFRENGKVKSVYIKNDELDAYRNLITRRNELIIKLKELKADKKKLEKVLR